MSPEEFLRLANNFYLTKNLTTDISRISLDAEMVNYVNSHMADLKKKFKIAFVFICLNPLYWQYAPEMIFGARQFFLPGHNTDFFFWTDIPEKEEEIGTKVRDAFTKQGINLNISSHNITSETIIKNVKELRQQKGIHIIPTESVEWPYPTLLRYNLFLEKEEELRDFDYIFYLDIDMQFVNAVGDEILPKEGLMATEHPMYSIRKELYPPIEPNPESASYIKRPGHLIPDGKGLRFKPLYFAGGFQGGKSDKFIQAMKDCRKLIEADLNRSYIPIWNDETVWNKYLFDNPPEIVLDAAYIYPDSLIKEYYEPIVWGKSYIPRIKTLTKWFSVSKEGGQAVANMIKK